MQCTDQKTIYVTGVSTPVNVPCGKCIPCLVNKRGDWSLRVEQEHRVSKSAHFVTLTYDAKHLRTNRSLCKRDLQLYLKRLRKKDELAKLRYYAVGEYGSKHGRPHYHLILFNSTEADIRSAWLDSKGHYIGMVHVGTVTGASIQYATKYIIQQGTYPPEMEKPFATMSRRYGIGAHYLSDIMVAWHREDDRNYLVLPGGTKCRLPRFYRDKIFYGEQKLRVSCASMKLTLENQQKEKEYYALKYGSRGPAQMADAKAAVISRVKQKISYSQTF